MIKDVEIKTLVLHKDDRGFFCELIRKSDSFFKDYKFGQLSHSFCKNRVFLTSTAHLFVRKTVDGAGPECKSTFDSFWRRQ